MSAMVRTSIQACGTATTTLAKPKPSPSISTTRLFDVRDHLAHQILAGHAEVHGAGRELAGDFGRRQIGDFDAVKPGDGAAIVARAARLDQSEAGAREERFRVFLQAALGRNGEYQWRAHDAASVDCQPLDPDRETDRRDRLGRAEPREQFVIAAASDQRIAGALRVGQFEHEAGVIVEAAPERG